MNKINPAIIFNTHTAVTRKMAICPSGLKFQKPANAEILSIEAENKSNNPVMTLTASLAFSTTNNPMPNITALKKMK